eukprot:CAMPEP_0206406428 /NCGR_PEP_ID=MMETSP0294-20121207/29778_1 /ASSEMBLY_ACC=CAM_ASM_000327 /TAXON_ID=39354 /ORGANISM="Heterosigma akashiwo, Strain CCMP2393" /LENGTH=63 /DNA_ID=CAMNT_0053865155 /DNA_START=5 /DNA_END=196 /DNA_ORIENTATION=-
MGDFVARAEPVGKDLVGQSRELETRISDLGCIGGHQEDVPQVFQVLSAFIKAFEKARDWDDGL